MSTVPTQQIMAAIREAAGRGLNLAGEHVLGVSNDQVPHEEGTLERSGRVNVDGLTVAVSYDTPYAIEQHEDLTYRHDPGRNAKFLENAFNSERNTAAQLIATAIRRKLD